MKLFLSQILPRLEEAVAYLEALRQRIQFTGISDVKMEEGSMRVDTNISIRPIGSGQVWDQDRNEEHQLL